MRRLFTAVLLGGLGLGLSGCGDKAENKVSETTTTPGGTTTVEKSTEVKQSGENPPPAGAEPAAPVK